MNEIKVQAKIVARDVVVMNVGTYHMIGEGWCATVGTRRADTGWTMAEVGAPTLPPLVGIDVAIAVAEALRVAATFDVAALARTLEALKVLK